MQPESAYPSTIHARVHDSAIDRVSRFFNATLDDAFVELLQNARRAGATAISVRSEYVSERQYRVAVVDDGAGIPDPSILLSFGESAWTGETEAAEDPAGIGFYSLSKFGCSIASRPRADGRVAPGWRAELTPESFLGKTGATVRADDRAPEPHGTAISFLTAENTDCIGSILAGAAQYFPLPVGFNGRTLHRKPFLDRAIHTETWSGLEFGVYRNDYPSWPEHDVNFHGRTFRAGLPGIECIAGGTWSARADIRVCPDFELALPARKEPVVNDFLKEMREAAERAVFRAIAAHETGPRLAFRDYRRANEAGVRIPQPPPALEPWRPPVACIDNWRAPDGFETLRPSALVMTAEPETHHGQALWRALERAGISARLFAPDRRFEGYAWYDALPRVTGFSVHVTHQGRTHSIVHPDEDGADAARDIPDRAQLGFGARPDAILMRLHVSEPGIRDRIVEIPADVVFMNREEDYVEEIDPLVTAGSDISPGELARLIHRAFFSSSDDADADSHETQKIRFGEDAMRIALTLLASEDEALRHAIAEAIRREVLWAMPRGREVGVTVKDGKVSVHFVSDAEPQPGAPA